MRVIKTTATRTCVVCERTLLQGEHALRFSPDGSRYVDVCPLCSDAALDYGWVKEGVAISPMLQQPPRRRRQRSLWQSLLGAREDEIEPVVSEPILRRLGDDEIALVEAAELFNATQFRRTIAGVGRGSRRAAGLHHPVVRCQRGDGAHVRMGYLLVPVPGLAGVRRSPFVSRSGARTSTTSIPASSSGTRP